MPKGQIKTHWKPFLASPSPPGTAQAVCLFLLMICDGEIGPHLTYAINRILTMQIWCSLHRLASHIPLSAWIPHMPHMACPYAMRHMPKYAQIWLNMPFVGIWHMAYGHVIWGMCGVQALSGMYIDGL